MPSVAAIRKIASVFIPLSVFMSPFLLVSAEWRPSIINPLIKNYTVVLVVLALWNLFLSATGLFIAGGKKQARSKFRYALELLLVVITGIAALIAIHFLRQRFSPVMFYLTLASAGFLSLEFAMFLREKAGPALLMRFLFLNCLCALGFQISVPGFNWQLLIFSIAVSAQASSIHLKKYTEKEPVHPLMQRLLEVSVFTGPLIVGLLALLGGILVKYLLVYILLPLASMVVKETYRPRTIAAFYWVFMLILLIVRLL